MTYAPPPPPARPLPSPPPRRRGPWWKSLWFVAGAAAVIGLSIGSAAASGSKPKAEPGPTVTATSTVTAQATVTATPTVVRTIATRTHTRTVTYTPPVKVAFSDGTYLVGREIRPGLYHTDPGSDGCYYERDNSGEGIDKIIDNDNITGPTTIRIASSDYAFHTEGGCDWTRMSG